MDVPSSPSKRSRVTFNSDVEVVSPDDEEDVDPFFAREDVRRAIQRHLVGDDEAYERVRAIFTKPYTNAAAPSTRVVRVYLQALLTNISSLDKSCNALVNAVLFTEWVGRDENFFSLYGRFVGNLAAAQSGYVVRILSSLVDLLGLQKTRRVPDCKTVRSLLIYDRVMQVIQHVIELLPAASNALVIVAQKKLSYDFPNPQERMQYMQNFMRMIGYIPEMSSDILAIVCSEVVKLDVSVQVDLEDEDEDISDELLQDLSSSQTLITETANLSLKLADKLDDDDDKSTSDESDLDDELDLNAEARHRKRITDNVRQVDALMDMLFRYYDEQFSSNSLEIRDQTTELIINHFHNIILPTYRSRHSQFIVFHFAQLTPITVDHFVTSCISTLTDKHLSPILRQSAAAYLAGFVGRGAHVSANVVKDSFTLLCDELNILRRGHEPNCRGPDLRRYSTFYAIMQAIMYMFCFRWRDLAITNSEMDDDISDDEDEVERYHFSDSIRDTLSSAIHSPMNPLRVCTSGIVEQFAKIAHHLHFLYLFTKIEANKHVRLTASRTAIADLTLNQPDRDLSWIGENGMMEGYFPYDPYQLPVSRKWLEGDYLDWRGVPEEEGDDSDSEAEEMMTDEDENELEDVGTPQNEQ